MTGCAGLSSPGEFFFYNNWSFNALGAIFENLTKIEVAQAFKDWVADPIGMQDFRVEDVRYSASSKSIFPAYRFWMSARDLARFGVLFAREGEWNGEQLIPRQWVRDSVKKHSELEHVAYGYMWWIWPDGQYMATGTGGQKIWIHPDHDLVMVNRVDTGDGFTRALWFGFGPRMSNTHMRKLERLFVAAAPPD